MDNLALQARVLQEFFAGEISGTFYLTGGTALARYYFQHRKSLDLDLFTNEQAVDFDFINRSALRLWGRLGLGILNQVSTGGYLQYIVEDEDQTTLKVDIVKDIPVHFGELRQEGSIQVDSLENIGSNKVLAVFGRTEAKDFIDLYWILQQTSWQFDQLFEMGKQKDLGLSELYLAYAMQNVASIQHLPQMLKPLDWGEVVDYFQQLSRDLLMRIRPG